MKLWEQILEAMQGEKEAYLSGEELAVRFGVTRAAVWKAVEALRKQGYEVDAVPKKGYRLSGNYDVLSPENIRSFLRTEYPFQLVCLDSVGSTNRTLKDLYGAEDQKRPKKAEIRFTKQTCETGDRFCPRTRKRSGCKIVIRTE